MTTALSLQPQTARNRRRSGWSRALVAALALAGLAQAGADRKSVV